MNASAYLKKRLLAERKIALSLEKGIQESVVSAGKTLDDIYSGIERISWYSSCFIDRHQDICRQLKAEDIRMIKAVMMLYQHKDVIAEIVIRYIDYVLTSADPSKARALTLNTSGFIAESLAGKAAKEALAYSLAGALLTSDRFSLALNKLLVRSVFNGFSIAQFYGKAQKAAMASRRLKELDPEFYKVLYRLDIEMLYIYTEPLLAEIIKKVNALPNRNPENIINILQEYQ